jgi:hypothetical protein
MVKFSQFLASLGKTVILGAEVPKSQFPGHFLLAKRHISPGIQPRFNQRPRGKAGKGAVGGTGDFLSGHSFCDLLGSHEFHEWVIHRD